MRVRMDLRPSRSGRGIANDRGNRRKIARSTLCGRLVAPNTKIPSVVDMPSHRTKNSDLIVALAEFSNPSRGFKKVSNSSIKMMEGASFWANPNVAAINLLDSPNHLSMILLSLTSTKVASASLAMALANMVLPVPGFPYKRIPRGGCTNLFDPNKSGRFKGNTASCQSSFLIRSKPPISIKVISIDEGSTTSSAIMASWEVSAGNLIFFPPRRLARIFSNRPLDSFD
mmetsp:Transcript_11335/g.26275  ORF Transcript_11335/g.26275 Transcript_11335/m.26275 type:complete len:228 (-) Transcript_11335:74-757(-)